MTYYWSNTYNCIYTGDLQSGDRLATDVEIESHLESTKMDYTLFHSACSQFRSVCNQIGLAIGNPDFRGGFDEYATFIQSDYAQQHPEQASLLASMWSGANEYAKYEGQKVGYGQPEWWYKCWEDQ